MNYSYFWAWGPGRIGRLPGRKGQHCRVLVRGGRNSCLIEFPDGFRAITSRNGLRRLSPVPLTAVCTQSEGETVD
jgi:hypothetical protein